MAERSVEAEFVRQGGARGVWVLKFVSPGVAGVPDRVCLAPGGKVAFVELKRRGAVPRALQRWVHRRLRHLGFRVAVVDTHEGCEQFFREWLGA